MALKKNTQKINSFSSTINQNNSTLKVDIIAKWTHDQKKKKACR